MTLKHPKLKADPQHQMRRWRPKLPEWPLHVAPMPELELAPELVHELELAPMRAHVSS